MNVQDLIKRLAVLEAAISTGERALEHEPPRINCGSSVDTLNHITISKRDDPFLYEQGMLLFENKIIQLKDERKGLREKLDAINLLLEG